MKELINKIALGTVQFGLKYGISNHSGQTSLSEFQQILTLAKDEGIDILDTAHGYGEAEERLGNFDLHTFQIITKFLPSAKFGPLKAQLQSGLDKLRLSSVYGYLAHRPENLLVNDEEWRQLNKLKEEGKVKKIGFSLNTPEELRLLLAKNMLPDLIQVPFNYLDNRFVEDMIMLHERGCEIHARSAFLQGLFFCDVNQLGNFFNEVKPVIEKLQQQKEALSGLLLKYCLRQHYVDKVVMGVNSAAQLLQNIQALRMNENELSNHEFSFAEEVLMPSKWPK